MGKSLPIVFAALCAGFAGGQTAQYQNGSATNLPVQKIGANDLIAISVYDAPEFTRTLRVSAEGDISLPMIRRKIHAEGLLPDALEASIASALASENLLVNPAVTITIVEYNSRPISVVGAVRRPLTFQASGPVTLIDAITRAEGLSADAGSEILISRMVIDGNGFHSQRVDRIPVKKLIEGAEAALNQPLNGGEQVRVPEIGKVFVLGNVRKPGSFRVEDGSGTSVRKVLALSEGLMPFAGKQAFIYRRTEGSAVQAEIPIELSKIMERKAPDLPLAPDDILYIPDSKGRRLAATTLERLSGFGSSTATGLLVWRR
jgi:polysaccharide export outer membrane protein